MENDKDLKEIFREVNNELSKLQSTLRKLENVFNSKKKPIEPSVMESELNEKTPEVEEATSNLVSENVNEEKILPSSMPTVEETPVEEVNNNHLVGPDGQLVSLTSEDVKEEEPVKEEAPVPTTEEVDNSLSKVSGYGESPDNLNGIKEYFNSEKLQSIINGYESAPVLSEQTPVEESAPVIDQPELNLNTPVEETTVQETALGAIEPTFEGGVVEQNIGDPNAYKFNAPVNSQIEVGEPQTTILPSTENSGVTATPIVEPAINAEQITPSSLENPVIPPIEPTPEEPITENHSEAIIQNNPEAVAENLANTVGEDRMLSIEEMLKNMDQGEGKAR